MATTATWQSHLQPFEAKYGIPAGLLQALVRAESGGNPNARSPVGAIGLGQLMPGTARSLGVNPNDPIQNLRGAAMYLSQQMKAFGGDVNKALAAYNAGPGAVRQYGGIPPYAETKKYIERVNQFWKEAASYGKTPFAGSLQAAPSVAVGAAPVRKLVPGTDDASIAKLQVAFMDAPEIGSAHVRNRLNQQSKYDADYAGALQKYQTNQQQAANRRITNSMVNNYTGGAVVNPGAKGWFRTPNGLVRNRMEGEAGWQFLQRLGSKGFGLLNDPGTSQTYGGRHSAGSLHGWDSADPIRMGRAIDYGTARNPWSKLNQWYNYLDSRRDIIGIAELLNEGDHIHAGLRN